LADDVLHALQRRRLHQGPGGAPDDARPDRPWLLDPRPSRRQRPPFEEAGQMRSLQNILWLGLKEIRSFLSDATLLLFVVYAFTWTVYSQATGTSNEVNNASIAFADEDNSALSKALMNAFYPPRFQYPDFLAPSKVEDAMDR